MSLASNISHKCSAEGANEFLDSERTRAKAKKIIYSAQSTNWKITAHQYLLISNLIRCGQL